MILLFIFLLFVFSCCEPNRKDIKEENVGLSGDNCVIQSGHLGTGVRSIRFVSNEVRILEDIEPEL